MDSQSNAIKIYKPETEYSTQSPGLMPQKPAKMSGLFNEDYTNTQSPYTKHEGIDWGVKIGTNIKLTRSAKVVKIGNDPEGYGNYLILQDVKDPTIFYLGAHMDKINVKQDNTTYEEGTIIGQSGDTGAGPEHFHTSTFIVPSGNLENNSNTGLLKTWQGLTYIDAKMAVNPFNYHQKWIGKLK